VQATKNTGWRVAALATKAPTAATTAAHSDSSNIKDHLGKLQFAQVRFGSFFFFFLFLVHKHSFRGR
jgi:hypothetical protein